MATLDPNHPLNRQWLAMEYAMLTANKYPSLRQRAERIADAYFDYVESLIAENERRKMRAATRGL